MIKNADATDTGHEAGDRGVHNINLYQDRHRCGQRYARKRDITVQSHVETFVLMSSIQLKGSTSQVS